MDFHMKWEVREFSFHNWAMFQFLDVLNQKLQLPKMWIDFGE